MPTCCRTKTAARKLIEIASGVEAAQDGRIHIEKVNGPFPFEIKRQTHAIECGWMVLH